MSPSFTDAFLKSATSTRNDRRHSQGTNTPPGFPSSQLHRPTINPPPGLPSTPRNHPPTNRPPHRMNPHKYHQTQLIFVKNVPQESTTNVAKLYAQYKPLSVKNLYEDGRITTLMIVLPTAEIAAIALERTDGMKVDSTVISVERYNAKQSTVARRETRRNRSGGQAYTNDDEYNGYEQEDLPDSWEDEVDSYAPEAPIAIQREASKPDGVSWADVTKGVSPRTPSPLPAKPMIAPQSSIITPASTRPQRWHPSEGEIRAAFYPSTPGEKSSRSPTMNGIDSSLTVTPRAPPMQMLAFNRFKLSPVLSTPSPEYVHTAPQGPTPTNSSDSQRVDVDSSQVTQVPNTSQQQRESLASSTDTTAYIRSLHCADCTFCKMREQCKTPR